MYLTALFAPFLGSALAGLMGRWIGARGSGIVTITGLFTRMIFSYFIFYEVLILGSPVVISLGSWFGAHSVNIDWLQSFDALTASMMVTVSTVSFCVHIYSLGYMQADPHQPRFLSYQSLFTGSMQQQVRANDLVTLLVGWEMIGVCSYQQIGFWFHRLSRTKAAQKAMQVNRVSDTILLIGQFFCWWYQGSTDTTQIRAVRRSADYSDLICLFLAGGALGKSAQVGLHVWLADAMEGPTPVSAQIHAATQVTAGIFQIARTNPLWEQSVSSRRVQTIIGAVTRLMRRTMGTVQNDVKRVIAYSTCSQQGYMMVAQSMSHYGLAMYHQMTHACFKAQQFQGAGVVIHANLDVQDMRRSGGAHSALPLAWTVQQQGSLSLQGWPFQAGYYSKDAIQEVSQASSGSLSAYGHQIQMTVALLTSAYSFRVLLLVFYAPNNRKKNRQRVPGVPFSMTMPLCILRILSIFRGYFQSDRTIGWGSDFWGRAILNSPGTNRRIRSHMIPVWVSVQPVLTVFQGQRAASVFVKRGPLPFCAENGPKKLYIFLRTRWGFDQVWNSQISLPVLIAGRRTWKSIDKGVLELQGPRGITTTQSSMIVPSVQKFSTGAVHDYALLQQILIVVGLLLQAFPYPAQVSFRRISFKTATLLFLFYVISLSRISSQRSILYLLYYFILVF